MKFKQTKKLLSLLIVLCMVFSLCVNAFAYDGSIPDMIDPPTVLDQDMNQDEEDLGEPSDDDFEEDEDENDPDLEEEPSDNEEEGEDEGNPDVEEEPWDDTEEGQDENDPDLEEEPMDGSEEDDLGIDENELNLEATLPFMLSSLRAVNPLNIKSVEVIYGGDIQLLYRAEVYKGLAENGEDPDKYYTLHRDFNLKEPRIFNLEFEYPAESIVDPDAFLDAIEFRYGGYPLSQWGNGKNLRGSTSIFTLLNKDIEKVDDVYKITASIRVDSPWGSPSNASWNNNIPYNGYYGGNGGAYFGSGQTADNRSFFQFGPAYQGPGTYALEALISGQLIASTDVHIGPYDGYHSWIEINEFCQDLIEALTGERVDLDEKPYGLMAAGPLVKNEYGEYERDDDGVYVEVSILGYGLTDNYMPENANYNNYSRFNAIWNVVVAKDEKTVTDYLKPGGFKDQMNDNPQALIDKYIDADPEDIDFVIPFYMNNVHSDEISGTDTMIHFIDAMIEGGKEGKTIRYKTFENDQINWNYRPSGARNQSYTAYNHIVNSTEWYSDESRKEMTINTADVLDKFIMVNTLTNNPDGKAAMRRTNRYGLDINRDTVFATQPEAIALTEDIAKWDPIVMLEWHGYVSQMLIEPCTAPHCPNYEPDLTLNNMIQLAYYGGKALTASTGYNRFLLPWDSMDNGWDDGGNVYGPMFSMLFGCMGWTIELPHSNLDSLEAGNAITYAMLNALMYGETAYYDGNVLNRSIDGKDSHEVDIKYTSLRKESILNKFEFKRRGVENIDSEAADKYFIETVGGVARYVGRVRKDDGQGGKLPFFPDYLVVPSSPEYQFNVAEALRTVDFTMRYGAKVLRTTEPVTYNGVTYPAGTYVYDMRQGRRNFIAEIMSKGYDATYFDSMYADIYCNFPDTRGFDCFEVWSPGLFDGKTEQVVSIEKQSNIVGAPDKYVVFKSNSTDAVRFVNLLLSGRSSGPSYIDEKKDVWMLRKSVEGVGTMSDYIIEAENLPLVYALVDNPDLGLKGCYLEGKYISELPKEAVKLVEPVISMNSTRNAATAGGAIYWALDDFLGFGCMKDEDGSDYNGNSNNSVRPGANVVLLYNATAGANLVNAIKENKLALIMVQSAGSLTNQNFGTGSSAPSTGSFGDVALYGQYNVDDSIITANYANTDTIYARGNYFTGNIPAGSKILFRTRDGDAFIGGYQRTGGDKQVFQNRVTMFSTILKGGGIEGKPVQSVTFGANMFYRPHYQKYYPMLATAIFAGAAGILDDQMEPVINTIELEEAGLVRISASDDDSGVATYTLYIWDPEAEEYTLVTSQADGLFTIEPGVNKYMVVVADYAGNEVSEEFVTGNFVSLNVAPNVILGEDRNITFRVSVDYPDKVHVMEGWIKINDDRFEFTDITPLISGENLVFTKNLDYNKDGTTAYFNLGKVDGLDNGLSLDLVDVTISLKAGETADKLEAVLDSIGMYFGYIDENGEHKSIPVPYQILDDGKAFTNIWFAGDVLGDFNGDDQVNGADLAISMTYFGAEVADEDWYTSGAWRIDLNRDGKVDIADLTLVALLAANLV